MLNDSVKECRALIKVSRRTFYIIVAGILPLPLICMRLLLRNEILEVTG